MAISNVAVSDTLGDYRTALNTVIDRWNNLGTYDVIVITGGAIDGTEIGGSTPDAGTFTNLTVSSTADFTGATLILDNDSISGDKISGGTITCDYLGLSYDPSGGTHAVRKSYLDTQLAAAQAAAISYSIVFGG